MSLARLALKHVANSARTFKRRWGRIMICVSIVLVYSLIIFPYFILRSQRAEVAEYDVSIANLPPPRVFVAAMLANCAPLLSAHWIPSLLGLIDKLGHENVFVSILENGSVDNTRAALQELERMLTQRNVPYTFRYEESFRDGVKFQTDGLLQRLLGEEGTHDNWIMTDGGWYPRRISYLAQLRNLVLEPLCESKRTFDKVLFINDVIFSVLPFARGS
jgi:hypothetical protein